MTGKAGKLRARLLAVLTGTKNEPAHEVITAWRRWRHEVTR